MVQSRAFPPGARGLDSCGPSGQPARQLWEPTLAALIQRAENVLETADLAVCEVSYIARGYKGQAVPGLVDKDFVTQARNAEMVEECDRYLIL